MKVPLTAVPAPQPDTPVILIVGNRFDWLAKGRDLPDIPGMVFEDFRNLGDAILGQVQPMVIVSALFGPGFDALDVALALQKAGFTGIYRAVAENIPRPDVIDREVRAIAPDIEFSVLTLQDLELSR